MEHNKTGKPKDDEEEQVKHIFSSEQEAKGISCLFIPLILFPFYLCILVIACNRHKHSTT
jgi:hypothetical protein